MDFEMAQALLGEWLDASKQVRYLYLLHLVMASYENLQNLKLGCSNKIYRTKFSHQLKNS